MKEKDDQINLPGNEADNEDKMDLPGNPVYPAGEDIYNKYPVEENTGPGDIPKIEEPDEDEED
jgi:hypothetical protein